MSLIDDIWTILNPDAPMPEIPDFDDRAEQAADEARFESRYGHTLYVNGNAYDLDGGA